MLSSLAYQSEPQFHYDSSGLLHYQDITDVLGINKTVLGYYWTVTTFYVDVDLNHKDNVERCTYVNTLN